MGAHKKITSKLNKGHIMSYMYLSGYHHRFHQMKGVKDLLPSTILGQHHIEEKSPAISDVIMSVNVVGRDVDYLTNQTCNRCVSIPC